MSTAESIDDLKQQVAVSLENMGVLSKIRAQLRSYVYAALREQDAAASPSPQSPVLSQDPSDVLMVDLIREFFEFYSLDYTWSVFSAEANVSPPTKSWRILSDASGLKGNAKRNLPLLTQIMTQFLAGKSAEVLPSQEAAYTTVPETSAHSTAGDKNSTNDNDNVSESGRLSEGASSLLTGSYPHTLASAKSFERTEKPVESSVSTLSTLTGSFPPTTEGPTIMTRTEQAEEQVESFIEMNESLNDDKEELERTPVYGSAESGLVTAARAAANAESKTKKAEDFVSNNMTRSLETDELLSVAPVRDTVFIDEQKEKDNISQTAQAAGSTLATSFNASNFYDDEFEMDGTYNEGEDVVNESQLKTDDNDDYGNATEPKVVAGADAAAEAEVEAVVNNDVEDDFEEVIEVEDQDDDLIDNMYEAKPVVVDKVEESENQEEDAASPQPDIPENERDDSNSNPTNQTKSDQDDSQNQEPVTVDGYNSYSHSQDSQFMQYEMYSQDPTFVEELDVDHMVDLVPGPDDYPEENYGDESYGLGDSAFRY